MSSFSCKTNPALLPRGLDEGEKEWLIDLGCWVPQLLFFVCVVGITISDDGPEVTDRPARNAIDVVASVASENAQWSFTHSELIQNENA